METLHTIRKWLDRIVGTICILLFALMVVVGSYQIITRFIFNNPSTISEELLTYSFAWMAMFATAYVFGKRDHMRMTFVVDKLAPAQRKVLEIVLEILVIAAGNRVYGLIRIRHGIQKCVQRTFYQFHKGVLDRKLIRAFQYTVFQYMGKSRTVIGRCTETDIEHLVLILIGHQKNPGAAFYVFQHHGPGVHFLHVHLF